MGFVLPKELGLKNRQLTKSEIRARALLLNPNIKLSNDKEKMNIKKLIEISKTNDIKKIQQAIADLS